MIQAFIKTLFILLPVFYCAPFYTHQSCSNPFNDISESGTRWNANDDDTLNVSIGFSFNFYGACYSDVLLSSNGFMGFNLSMDSNCCFPDDIPNTTLPNNWILMYQEDMRPAPNYEIHYETKGAAPNRQFIYQFKNVPEYHYYWLYYYFYGWKWDDWPEEPGGANTFQAVLYESSNLIQLRYGPLNPPDFDGDGPFNPYLSGDVPSIGIENADGTEAISIDATTVSDGTCIQFNWKCIELIGSSSSEDADLNITCICDDSASERSASDSTSDSASESAEIMSFAALGELNNKGDDMAGNDIMNNNNGENGSKNIVLNVSEYTFYNLLGICGLVIFVNVFMVCIYWCRNKKNKRKKIKSYDESGMDMMP